MSTVTLAQAIASIAPQGSSFYMLDNNVYATLVWTSPDTTQPTEEEAIAQQQYLEQQQPLNDCKQKATQLLYETDWTTIPDVANPQVSNPYLMNQAEFATYRSALRQLAVYPVADPVWPVKPAEQWSK